MNTLSIGSLARNTLTFCCTKCFFLVLVLGASMTIGLEALPVLPWDAIITVTPRNTAVCFPLGSASLCSCSGFSNWQSKVENSTRAKLRRPVFRWGCRPRWTDSSWKWTTLGCWSVAVLQMLLPLVQRNRSWYIVTAGMRVRLSPECASRSLRT